jgi:hypothetical protein
MGCTRLLANRISDLFISLAVSHPRDIQRNAVDRRIRQLREFDMIQEDFVRRIGVDQDILL